MFVPLGEMREAVVTLTPTTIFDESGGETVEYVESDPIFVAIRALTAKETQSFGQLNANITHVCFGHWGDLNALAGDTRIRMVESSQEFDIDGLPINSPKRDWSKLTLVYRENG